MTRSKAEEQRERFFRISEQEFRTRIEREQGRLMLYLNQWLSDQLKVDTDGKITFSVANNTLLGKMQRLISEFWKTKGLNTLKWVVNQLLKVGKENDRYFKTFLEYPKNISEKATRQIMGNLGFDTKKNMLIPGGYLATLFESSETAQKVSRDVANAISSGMPLKAFRKQFKKSFVENGYLEKHFNTMSRDLFASVDRTYQNIQGQALGLDWAVYAGTLKDNSRCFCRQRLNGIFDRKTIESWNDLEWKGKNPHVSVFQALAGYNCRHHLSWVTEAAATALAKRRGIELNGLNKNVSCDIRTE
jgi:hypothetical protein